MGLDFFVVVVGVRSFVGRFLPQLDAQRRAKIFSRAAGDAESILERRPETLFNKYKYFLWQRKCWIR